MKTIRVKYGTNGKIIDCSDVSLYFEQENNSLEIIAEIETEKNVRAYINGPNNNSTVTDIIGKTNNLYVVTIGEEYMSKGTMYIGFEVFDDDGYVERYEPLQVYIDGFINLGGGTSDNVYVVTAKINAVQTLGAGEDAYVENIGTSKDLVLNIGIPQGVQGVPGYTPRKGIDYYTDDEINELKAPIEKATAEAIESTKKADEATENANKAIEDAEIATKTADDATANAIEKAEFAEEKANLAQNKADTAEQIIQEANVMMNNLSEVITEGNEIIDAMQKATISTEEATAEAIESAERADEATERTNKAIEDAEIAANNTNEAINNANKVAEEIKKDADSGKFNGQQGIQGEKGNVLFASFEIDIETGSLIMKTDDEYKGIDFILNNNGYLEVSINA